MNLWQLLKKKRTRKDRRRRKRSSHRRPTIERMEDRLVLTSGLQFDSVVLAGGDGGVYPKAVITDAQGATYMGGNFYDTADFDLGASLPGNADLLTARGGRDGFVAKYAPNGSLEWAKRLGGDSTDDVVYGLELDAAGYLYVSGEFADNADIGPLSYQSAGKDDGFLAKMDAAGDFQWVQTWGGTENNAVDEMVLDSNGLLTIIGLVSEDADSPDSLEDGIEIRQYDTDGNVTWDYFLANDTYGKPDLAVGPNGDLVAVAKFRDTLDLDLSAAEFLVSGAGSVSNLFVLGLSSGGEFQWGSSLVSDRLADSSSSIGNGTVAVADDGSAAVITSGKGELRLGVGQDEQQASIGEVRRRVFTSFSSAGELQATTIHDDESSSLSNDVVAVGTEFYIAGSNFNSVVFQPGSGVTAYGLPNSVYVMGVDESGDPMSAIIVGGAWQELMSDIRLGHDGKLLVASSSPSSSIDLDPDPVNELIHFNPNGPDNSADGLALRLNLPVPGQPVTVFGDSFENGEWSNKWLEDSQNDWFTSTQRATVGSYSAEVDGRSTNATLTMATPLDLSGYVSAELTFDWLIENGFDSGEYVALDVFNGTSWTSDVVRLNGNSDPENTWHAETVDLTPYISAETLIRFRAKVSRSNEDANVDNVRIVASEPAGPPNELPVASAAGPYAVEEGSSVTLDGSASFDPDGTIASYAWDLDNDGQYDDATGPSASFSSDQDGLQAVGLQVTDDDGATATATANVTVANVAPAANAGGPYAGNEGSTIQLDASASFDVANDIVSYDWDLDGDGQYDDASGVTTPFSSTDDGIFSVEVRVTDDAGATNSSSTIVTVSNVAPTASAGAGYSAVVGENITLDASGSTDPGDDIVSYEWDLDADGQYDDAVGSTTTFSLPVAGDLIVGVKVTDDDGASSTANASVTVVEETAGPNLRHGVVQNVGSNVDSEGWTLVTLDHTYTSMVVVATVNYDSGSVPGVVRITEAAGNSFKLRVDGAGGPAPTNPSVHYVVVEEGVYTLAEHGVKMEARSIVSDSTAENNNWNQYETPGYLQSYSNPVVVGQVMTYNDSDWSVFWASGSSRTAPPSSTTLRVGKHVGEDSDVTRADETLGIFVLESTTDGVIDGLPFVAAVGADTIRGITNSPAYQYDYNPPAGFNAKTAVASIAGMDGGDGGWAVLYGNEPLPAFDGTLDLAIDEDQIANSERNHTTEQVAYFIIDPPLESPELLSASTALAFAQLGLRTNLPTPSGESSFIGEAAVEADQGNMGTEFHAESLRRESRRLTALDRLTTAASELQDASSFEAVDGVFSRGSVKTFANQLEDLFS